MTHRSSIKSLATFAGLAVFAGLPFHSTSAQLVTAESLLINVDAANFTQGSLTWGNSGTITGDFTANGTPSKLNVGTSPAVYFDETDFFVGPNSVAGIDAGAATYSIEVWAYQGFIRAEESLTGWSSRGNDNQNVGFNYGASSGLGGFGAMGHWGAAGDIGWGTAAPAAGGWHLLSYTYDGSVQSVYVDGVLDTSETLAAALDPKDALPINIGTQRDPGGGVTAALKFGGAISKVRIHDGVLSAADVLQNYNAEAAAFTLAGQQIPVGPSHRYNFSNLASGADGTPVLDVIGTAHGTIRGAGATVTATGVDLPGGSPDTQAYIDLPNGVISGTLEGQPKTSASYELWFTPQTTQNWSRAMDFGTTSLGELTGPGIPAGGYSGPEFLTLTNNAGTALNNQLERRFSAVAGDTASRQTQGTTINGTEFQLVITYDQALQEYKWFRNGVMMEGFSSAASPGILNDVNNWLGRSQFSGDLNTDAFFNEFRIYDYALSQAQVLGNFTAGPDVINVPEPTSAALLGLGVAGVLGWRRRRS